MHLETSLKYHMHDVDKIKNLNKLLKSTTLISQVLIFTIEILNIYYPTTCAIDKNITNIAK